VQNESYAQRRDNRPGQRALMLSTMSAAQDVATIGGTADKLYMQACQPLVQGLKATHVRVGVITASASTTMDIGLYYLDTHSFKAVPNTQATVSTAATGVITHKLTAPALVLATTQYFVGLRFSSAVPRIAGVTPQASSAMLSMLTSTTSHTVLPSGINANLFDKTTNNKIYGISYLSTTAAELL